MPASVQPTSPAERGAALIVMAIVAVLIGGLALGLLGENMAESRSVDTHRTSFRALEVAEAGIARAQVEVRALADPDGDGVGNLTQSYGGGTYEVTAVQSSDNPDRWTLTATGTVGEARRRVEVGVRRRPGLRHVEGLYSKETLEVGGDVNTDSYDSRNGSYASQAVNSGDDGWYALQGGDVGSGQHIVVQGSTAALRGNAIPGPGYQTQNSAGATITGDTLPREQPVVIPDPTYAEFQGALAANNNAALVGTEAFGADEAILSWINDADLRGLSPTQVDGLSLANLMLLGEDDAGGMRFDELLASTYSSLVQVPTSTLATTVDDNYTYYVNTTESLYPEKYLYFTPVALPIDSDEYAMGGTTTTYYDRSQDVYPTSVTPPPGRVSYNMTTYELRASAGAAVVLEGGTYFFSDLRLSGNAYLVVRNPSTIYVTGRLDLSGGVIMNVNGKPEDLRVVVHPYALPAGSPPSASYVKVRGGSVVAAALYAPEVPVSIGGTGHFYGSVVGRRIGLQGTGSYHYDQALAEQSDEDDAYLERLYWLDPSPPNR